MYTRHQIDADFGWHMGYKRTDDLLLYMGTGEGALNPLLEGDNEDTDEEENTAVEEDVGKD